MKKLNPIQPLSVRVVLALLLASCSDDNFDYCSNPLGTTPQQGGNGDVVCFRSCGDGCYTECLKFEFNGSSLSFRSVIITRIKPGGIFQDQAETANCPTSGNCVVIQDIGEVACISSFVNNIKPSSGYSSAVPMVVKHGYVVKLSDGTFGSIYLDSFTGTGFNRKANILWHYYRQ